MRILVTGGAGYIGSVLVRRLIHNCDHDVTVLDSFRHRVPSLAHLCSDRRLAIINGDARDPVAMERAMRDVDVIIPLAAIVGAPACVADPVAALTTNFEAVKLICRLASHEQRIIIPNTNSGYGVGGDEECTEDSPLNPISLYGRTKVEAEKEVMARGNAIAFRLATVFGMSQRMRLDLLVNDFVYRAMTERTIVLFEPHFRRNFIHVQDVARVFEHAIANFHLMNGKIYNVGLSNANLTKLQLCEMIKKQIPDLAILEGPGADPDKRDYYVSNARIEAMGWTPAVSLPEGIAELKRGLPMFRGGTGFYANT